MGQDAGRPTPGERVRGASGAPFWDYAESRPSQAEKETAQGSEDEATGLRSPPRRRDRPPASELRQRIVGVACENPRWGYRRIQGELLKLGHHRSHLTFSPVSITTDRFPSPASR
jgi:hypothetical protein